MPNKYKKPRYNNTIKKTPLKIPNINPPILSKKNNPGKENLGESHFEIKFDINKVIKKGIPKETISKIIFWLMYSWSWILNFSFN